MHIPTNCSSTSCNLQSCLCYINCACQMISFQRLHRHFSASIHSIQLQHHVILADCGSDRSATGPSFESDEPRHSTSSPASIASPPLLRLWPKVLGLHARTFASSGICNDSTSSPKSQTSRDSSEERVRIAAHVLQVSAASSRNVNEPRDL